MQGNVIYVKAGATGNGASWQNALGDLQAALKAAHPGDQIWVAQGTYLPTQSNDRLQSFVIPDNIQLLGGFQGVESFPQERDWRAHPTILSGAIGDPLDPNDNSYTVVYTRGVSPATVIDGFIIAYGNANRPQKHGNPQSSGGGWFNDATDGVESSPTILNCLFLENRAFYGAGIYNHAGNGLCRTRIENCQFEGNIARLDGAGIYNNGSYGICNAVVIHSQFSENQASYGAGILNTAEHGENLTSIENCRFIQNKSLVKGSGVYNHQGANKGRCIPVIIDCSFDGNSDNVGTPVSNTTQEVEPRRSSGSILVKRAYD